MTNFLSDILANIRWHWLNFTSWLKANPTRYRITVALCLPTVPFVTLACTLILWPLAMFSVFVDGFRALKAGRPQ